MHSDLKKARECIIDQIAKNMTLYGVMPSVGRLMGTMYYYDKPMTLDDMKSELGMSKASMSNAVRELMELELVEKVWKKGERKDLYKVEEDNYETFIRLFTHNWRKGLHTNSISINKSIKQLQHLIDDEAIDDETKEFARQDLDKLYAASEYTDWLNRVIDFFDSHEIFDYIPKKSEQVKSALEKAKS